MKKLLMLTVAVMALSFVIGCGQKTEVVNSSIETRDFSGKKTPEGRPVKKQGLTGENPG